MAVDRYFFLDNYLQNLYKLSLSLDKECLVKISETIINNNNLHGTVYIVGNGGSASIASHVAVDFLKSIGIKAMTFNESSLITCYANDYGYENWVKEALKNYSKKNDLVILISSSGESQNILNAGKYAIDQNLDLVTFSGFNKNNSLSKLGNFNIWVDSSDYNYVEIIHNQFLLMLVDLIKLNCTK
tara:strand:- start:242 stop:799 length:558 start_codon:yes stop_codon:yes gene_type:complete